MQNLNKTPKPKYREKSSMTLDLAMTASMTPKHRQQKKKLINWTT